MHVDEEKAMSGPRKRRDATPMETRLEVYLKNNAVSVNPAQIIMTLYVIQERDICILI